MASIGKKIVKGNTYYYARECKRVKGKPRITWQKYLGRLEDIVEAIDKRSMPDVPDEAVISRFGAVAALYDIASRWDIVNIIDGIADKREQGLGIGKYMLIAAINRCVCPKSKSQIGEWFLETPLRRWIPAERNALTSQRFWDNMALLNKEIIWEIEKALTEALIRTFNVDTRCLLYDTTNFASFIDSFNDKNTLAQRGKSKQGRKDLRIIGLALLVSSDFHIPLFHDVYKGNTHDSKEFDSVVERLVEQYKILSRSVENITLVFDKGNNSSNNVQRLEPYHFVGSLKLTEVEDLLKISLDEYEDVTHPRLSGVKAYRVQRKIYEANRTVLLTYNEELFLTQSQCLLRELRKRTGKLKDLASQISRWITGDACKGKKPTTASVAKNVKEIVEGQYMKQLIRTEIKEEGTLPVLSYSVDHSALDQIFRDRLGKTVLFTDNDSWENSEIVLAYRGQFRVEQAFQTMKDPHFVSWSPMWHWTDNNIRVHAFYCVLALTLASLLQRELHANGIQISIDRCIEELSGIAEVALITRKRGRQSEPQVVLSKMNALQQKMFEVLNLSRYAEVKV
jgi:transposase